MNTFRIDSAKAGRNDTGIMLPVVELVIAIGLFTIISVFLIRFFASANTMSRQADNLSKGLIKAESAIELLKNFSPEETAKELGGEIVEARAGKFIEAYYDKDWEKADCNSWKYSISIVLKDTPTENGTLTDINVFVNRNDGINNNIVVVHLEGASYSKGGK